MQVVEHGVVDTHRIDRLLHVPKLACAHDRIELLNRVRASTIEHLALNPWRRVANAEPNEKTIELRFRKRICSVELLRVLRGNHEERFFEQVGFAVDRNLTLIHRFEKRALRLGRRAIDFVGEEDLREDRTGPKLERALRLIEHVAAEHVGGHQVGRALKPSERDTDGRSERARQGRLADARDVLEQQVPARQERDDSQA